MKTFQAVALSQLVAELVKMCATFQATYGRNYILKPGSSPDAWAQYHQIFNQQVAIAQMLYPKALENPNYSFNRWWERQDTLDLSVAKTLMQQVAHLISTCAYFEAETQETDWSYAIYCAQTTIAGLLNPAALQVALSSTSTQSERYAG